MRRQLRRAARAERSEPGGARRRHAALLIAGALAGCGLTRGGALQGKPGGDEGMLRYTVGRLAFEAPAGWVARGDDRRIVLSHPDSVARLEAQAVEKLFRSEAACLAGAEESLARGSQGLTGVRRHPSAFAGRKAVVQEADQGAWHGWAWAVCDGASQYRVFFTGLSPQKQDVVDAWRFLTASAALGGSP